MTDETTDQKREREPWVYRCERHNYVLESRVPKMPTSLKHFCPLCKDEFFAKHLTELQNQNPNAGKFK